MEYWTMINVSTHSFIMQMCQIEQYRQKTPSAARGRLMSYEKQNENEIKILIGIALATSSDENNILLICFGVNISAVWIIIIIIIIISGWNIESSTGHLPKYA